MPCPRSFTAGRGLRARGALPSLGPRHNRNRKPQRRRNAAGGYLAWFYFLLFYRNLADLVFTSHASQQKGSRVFHIIQFNTAGREVFIAAHKAAPKLVSREVWAHASVQQTASSMVTIVYLVLACHMVASSNPPYAWWFEPCFHSNRFGWKVHRTRGWYARAPSFGLKSKPSLESAIPGI